MKLANFVFKKINIEKFSDNFENVKINSKIDVSDIKLIDSSNIPTEEALFSVDFSYEIDYSPKAAILEFKGKLFLIGSDKAVKEIVDQWKEKKMSEEFKVNLFNVILRKVNIKALELEEEMKLPLHIPLPTVKLQKEQ